MNLTAKDNLLEISTKILMGIEQIDESTNPWLDAHTKTALDTAKSEFIRTFLNTVLQKLDAAKRGSVIDKDEHKQMEKSVYAISKKLKPQIDRVKFSLNEDTEELNESIPSSVLSSAKAVGMNALAVAQIFNASKERNPKMTDREIYKAMDQAFAAMAKYLFKEETLDEAATGADFYLLPGNVINNELFVVTRNLNNLQQSLRNGNDLDLKGLKSIISGLQDIVRSAKKFKAGDNIPVSYQYKAR
jgi:hypothetical protein